jgi:hypothetical protein
MNDVGGRMIWIHFLFNVSKLSLMDLNGENTKIKFKLMYVSTNSI